MNDASSNSAPRPRRGLWVRLALLVAVIAAFAGWRYRVSRPDFRFERARAAIAIKDWDAANWYANRLEAAGRDDLNVLVLAEASYQRGDAVAALDVLQRYPEDGTRRAGAAVLVGNCLLGLNRLREASSAFRLALQLEPDNLEAHRGAAQVAYNVGQLETSALHLARILELDDRDGKPRKLLGDIHADLGRHDEAVKAYRAAIDRDLAGTFRADAYRSLAASLAKLRKYDEVLATWDEAKSKGVRDDAEWSALRVEALRGAGRGGEARKLVVASIGDHPGSAALLMLRGQLDLDDGRSADAVRSLEEAHRLAPRDYPLGLLLSQAYAADGRKADADRIAKVAEELRQDLELVTKLTDEAEKKPWDAAIRLQLAEVCERMGNAAMAKQWRETAAMLKK